MTITETAALAALLMFSEGAANAQTEAPNPGEPTTVVPATPPGEAAPSPEKPATEKPAEARPAVADDVSLSGGRTLNGHIFMPARSAPGPFAVTSFGSFMLLGLGSTTSSLTIGGVDLSTDLQYAGTGGELSYEYSFLDHFTVRAAADTAIYSGISGRAALAIGTSVQLGFSGGATASMPIGKTARIGLLFDLSLEPNVALTVGAGIRAILDSCAEPGGCQVGTGSILGITKVTSYRPVVSAGWSPWRPLGVLANVGTTIATAPGDKFQTGVAMTFGASIDFDFHPLWKVPVGLQLQTQGIIPVTGNTIQERFDLGGGIFYTGRQDLSAGVQVVFRRFAVTKTVDVSWSTVLIDIGLRYYW